MLALKVPVQDAEKTKQMLIKKGVLSSRFRVKRMGDFLYFPLEKKIRTAYNIEDVDVDPVREKKGLKQRLSTVLSATEMERLKTSADVIGQIAIIELDKEFDEKKHEIAQEFLKENKNIKTVLRKQGGHEGELRIQKYEWLAGEKTTVATHKENGAILKLDVDKVYYSPRTATERLRIAKVVQPGERVLVMFSGCAPFPCVIAKNAKPKEIVGIELNPAGHQYGLENVKLNKLKNVHLICGDVRKEVPKIVTAGNIQQTKNEQRSTNEKLLTTNEKPQTTFDRIIMPLPKTGVDFLDIALSAINSGGTIHCYSFQKEGELEVAADQIRRACKKAKKTCEILRIVKAGQIGQRMFRVCVDVEIGGKE